jgi:hypothetical protein
VDNPILGFNLPAFDSFTVIEGAEFAATVTAANQEAGFATVLYLFNSGITPSALAPGDALWNTDGLDTRW